MTFSIKMFIKCTINCSDVALMLTELYYVHMLCMKSDIIPVPWQTKLKLQLKCIYLEIKLIISSEFHTQSYYLQN